MKKTLYIVTSTLIIIGVILILNMSKANAKQYSLNAVNNSYFTNNELQDLSCVKIICGLDEYTISNTDDISTICNMFSSLKLTAYSGADILGFTLIKFVKSNGQELSISITNNLVYVNGQCFETNYDILSDIRKMTQKCD